MALGLECNLVSSRSSGWLLRPALVGGQADGQAGWKAREAHQWGSLLPGGLHTVSLGESSALLRGSQHPLQIRPEEI